MIVIVLLAVLAIVIVLLVVLVTGGKRSQLLVQLKLDCRAWTGF